MKGRRTHFLGYLLVACCVVTAVRGRTLECQNDGRFPHPQNCGNYVDCFRSTDGVFVAREGHCQGYPFSPEKRRCVNYSEKPDCVTKGIRTNFPASDFNYLCAQDPSAVGCANCKLAFSCINGNATLSVCDKNSVCGDTLEAFGYSVCLPPTSFGADDICSCTKVGLVKDPFNAIHYHYCDSDDGLPEIFSCEAGEEFIADTNECKSTIITPPVTPPCEETGTFVNPNDCTWSYTCLPNGEVRSSSCAVDEYYKEGGCEAKCESGGVTALETCVDLGLGFHVYDNDCSKYLVCKDTVNEPVVESCPVGFFFNEATKRCTDTTLPSRCQGQGEFNYLTCPGHQDVVVPCPSPIL